MQIAALKDENSMFITNQQIPNGLPKRILMEVGDSLPIADAQLKDLEQLGPLFRSTDQLDHINKNHLRWMNIIILVLILIGLLLGLALGNWIILAPLIAAVIRLVAMFTLMYQMIN